MLLICCPMQAQVRHEEYELLPSTSVRVGDINNDGFVDVVFRHPSNLCDGVILSIFINDGEGHLECSEYISSTKSGSSMFFLVKDFDGNGSNDIATYSYADNGNMNNDTCFLRIDYNDGNGRFERFAETALVQPEVIWYDSVPYHTYNPYFLGMATGDFNGDSFPDIAVANDYNSNAMSTLAFVYNDGAGNFDAKFTIGTLIGPKACDFNNDGKDEIVDNASLFYSSDSLTPYEGQVHPYVYDGFQINGTVVLDIDGDGLNDVVEGRSADNSHLWVFKNLGDGTFKKMDSIAFAGAITWYGEGGDNMKLVNYNGDEYPDIIVQMFDFRMEFSGYYVFEGNGTFEFDDPVFFPMGHAENEYIRGFEVSDLNNDGLDDLIVLHVSWEETSWFEVFFNDGQGNYDEIDESDAETNITLSPNPTSGLVRIGGGKAEEIQVYNSLGQWVKTYRNCNEIDLSNLPEGVYTLRISSEEGCTAKRVVKM